MVRRRPFRNSITDNGLEDGILAIPGEFCPNESCLHEWVLWQNSNVLAPNELREGVNPQLGAIGYLPEWPNDVVAKHRLTHQWLNYDGSLVVFLSLPRANS